MDRATLARLRAAPALYDDPPNPEYIELPAADRADILAVLEAAQALKDAQSGSKEFVARLAELLALMEVGTDA